MQPATTARPYGDHYPGLLTLPLRWITCIGLAHGKIAKILHKAWLGVHGADVDAEVRGLRYRLNLHDNTTDVKILISSKVYDEIELDALAATCRDLPFVDVGANIGYYSMEIAKRGCPSVLAIEPNPPTLQRLRYNLSLNALTDRVKVVAAGVGPAGELEFYQTGGLGGSSFVKPAHDAPVIKVRTIPLLDILAEGGIEKIGGMKIDVEGFEDQVLVPFLENAPDGLLPACVVMESCHEDEWKADLKGKFLACGYRLERQTRANLIFVR
jgi:FkbM family methyltransferase